MSDLVFWLILAAVALAFSAAIAVGVGAWMAVGDRVPEMSELDDQEAA